MPLMTKTCVVTIGHLKATVTVEAGAGWKSRALQAGLNATWGKNSSLVDGTGPGYFVEMPVTPADHREVKRVYISDYDIEVVGSD